MGADEAQDIDPKLKELADETARLKAELDKLTAQKGLDDARNEAATATAKSLIGEIPESPYTGEVELNEGMGVIESAALTARAVTQAAKKIAGSLKGDGGATLKGATLYIFQADETPKLDEAIVFDSHLSMLEETLRAAIAQSEELLAPERVEVMGVAPAFIAPAIEAAVKLLDLLRTDYSIGGVEISGYDQALLFEVAGALLRDPNHPPAAVHIPSLLFPEKILGGAEKSLVDRLKDMTRQVASARRYQKLHAGRAETLAKEVAKESDPEKKKELQQQAEAQKKAAEELGDAIQMYDALFGASDAKGVTPTMPLATFVKAQRLREALRQDKNSYVVALKVFKSGGTYYKKKSFWNVFRPWRIPVFLSGGVVCGFALLNGEGRVLASGSLPTHSPFVGLSDFGRSGETGDKPWYEDQQETPAEDDF